MHKNRDLKLGSGFSGIENKVRDETGFKKLIGMGRDGIGIFGKFSGRDGTGLDFFGGPRDGTGRD